MSCLAWGFTLHAFLDFSCRARCCREKVANDPNPPCISDVLGVAYIPIGQPLPSVCGPHRSLGANPMRAPRMAGELLMLWADGHDHHPIQLDSKPSVRLRSIVHEHLGTKLERSKRRLQTLNKNFISATSAT